MELLTKIQCEVDNGQISEYSEVTAKLAELKETYGKEVPDASTKAGYDRSKEIAKLCTGIRTATEAKRKEFKAPVLALGKMIDSEAKRIIAEVVEVEEPHKSAYQEVDQEKKRIKLEIEERIIKIKDMPASTIELDSNQVNDLIEELAEMDVSNKTFGRRADEASALVASTLEELSNICARKIEEEQAKQKAEENQRMLDQLLKEKQEREEAERQAMLKAEREAEDARIAALAAEKAIEEERQRQKAAAEKAEREKVESAEREARLLREAEEAEKRRIEAEKQAEIDKQAAIELAKQQEQARIRAEEQRKREEQEKLEANKRHCGKVHREIAESIIGTGISEDQAKEIVTLIAKRQVPHVHITY